MGYFSRERFPGGFFFILPVLFLLTLVYLVCALVLTHANIYFDHNNLFFSADHLEALRGWVPFHKGVHPLILVFVVPLTKLCRLLMNDSVLAGIVVNTGFGILGCCLAFLAFWKLLGNPLDPLLYTLFFGLTGSQWLFSAVPDSYSLAAVSIIFSFLLLIVCLKNQKLYSVLWVLAGILSFGVTITNFGGTLICFCAAMAGLKINRKFLGSLIYISIVLGLVTAANHAQLLYYPGSKLWYQPAEFSHEAQYMNFAGLLENPTKIFAEVLKNFFLFNVVLGEPALVALKRDGIGWSFYEQFRIFLPWGIPAIALWLLILGTGMLEKASQYLKHPLFWASCLSIAWNLGIHLIYGVNEIFLYSAHFTFPLILLSVPWQAKSNWKERIAFILLITFTGLNNLAVFRLLTRSIMVL
jgi:hypothetical protein